jgi:ATP-dependent Clp protease ATP-binding subunit ClpB
MSEYQEKFSVTRLIGSPPGYIGYEEGGQLTEAIRRKPYSVVLFDEIEKAHPDVFNILLQVLDDGRLTDNKGRVVDFKNTIIIMTSNLGSQLIREKTENITETNKEQVLEDTRKSVFELLKQVIKPEFLNRIDDLIMFTPLAKAEIAQIVRLQVEGVAKMLKNNGIDLQLTPKAIDLIASEGFDPQFGARPIKRALQRLLLNELSNKIIARSINKEKPILVDEVEGKLVFENK